MKRTVLIMALAIMLFFSGCSELTNPDETEQPSPSPVEQASNAPVQSESSDNFTVEAITNAYIKYQNLCAYLNPEDYREYYSGEVECPITVYGDNKLSTVFVAEEIRVDNEVKYLRYDCHINKHGHLYLSEPLIIDESILEHYIKVNSAIVTVPKVQKPDFDKSGFQARIERKISNFCSERILGVYKGHIFKIYTTGYYKEYRNCVEAVVVIDNKKVIPLRLTLSEAYGDIDPSISFQTEMISCWRGTAEQIYFGEIQSLDIYGLKKLENIKQSAMIKLEIEDKEDKAPYEEVRYLHDMEGMRTGKLTGNSKISYIYEGSQLVSENCDGKTIKYTYAEQPSFYGKNVTGMYYDNRYYQFDTNNNGSVLQIADTKGNALARYEYASDGSAAVLGRDEGGKWIDMSDEEDFIGNINKLRLYGFYYDEETGYYYHNGYYINPRNNNEFVDPNDLLILID